MNDFNSKFCDERHENIDKKFITFCERLDKMEGKIWTIILLLVANMGGILALIFQGGTP